MTTHVYRFSPFRSWRILGMAVATMVWSSAPRKSATMMPARVKARSLFVTVYMKNASPLTYYLFGRGHGKNGRDGQCSMRRLFLM